MLKAFLGLNLKAILIVFRKVFTKNADHESNYLIHIMKEIKLTFKVFWAYYLIDFEKLFALFTVPIESDREVA